MAGSTSPSGDSFADQAFAAAAKAYASAPEGWERSIQAAIAALFDFLADQPTQTAACVAVSPDALARRDHILDRFAHLLLPGFAATGAPPTPVVAEAIAGGIYEILRSHVLEQRLAELPEATADATIVALSPFLGATGAMELAS